MVLSLRYTVIDNCVVPRKLAKVIRTLKRGVPGAVLQSCYRGEDARRLLHKHGKHTQGELYRLYREGKGNPANPPGRSTHELRSDGVPYSGPIGRKLEWWECGMDWNDSAVAELIKHGHLHGYQLFRPYPTGSEYHHLNLLRKPR